MSASSLFSKSAVKASLWMGAIAGGLVAASMLFSAAPSRDSQAMQLDGFNSAVPEYAAPEAGTNSAADSAAMIALALVGGTALGLGVNAARKYQGVQPSAQSASVGTSFGQSQNTSYLHQANRSLRRKLLLLLHEDQQAAERLIQQASFRHPGKSPDWYLEKVIYDLQRDRGRI